MLDYDFGEMRSDKGLELEDEVYSTTADYAIRVSDRIEEFQSYTKLKDKLPSPRVILYFRFLVYMEIYPFIRQACVISWYKRNGFHVSSKNGIVYLPKTGIFVLLKEVWRFSDVRVEYMDRFSHLFKYGIFSWHFIKKLIKDSISVTKGLVRRLVVKNNGISPVGDVGGVVACHYAEGLSSSKRSDISWFDGCGIPPEKILIYIDSRRTTPPSETRGKMVSKETIKNIESCGFKWVALERNMVEGCENIFWECDPLPVSHLFTSRRGFASAEKWVVEKSNDLLRKVHYWRSFYDYFNVTINCVPEEQQANVMAQAIAFDIDPKKTGILIGKQRSEVYSPTCKYTGIHTKHLIFIWNCRTGKYFIKNDDHVENLIVSGYPYKIPKAKHNYASELRDRGAKFIIALFDNIHSKDSSFSKKKLILFYRTFLEWAAADKEVGLIIKSKKPYIIDTLPGIYDMIENVSKCANCIRLDDEISRFPSDASFGADMAVGFGISSAVMEAVISGCKGIHCDVGCNNKHEFYEWGREKIIFGDIDLMISAMKKFKDNEQADAQLGDWSRFMTMVDQFRDGKGSERMGNYMKLLLDAFGMGLGRESAIKEANLIYAKKWGKDKIVEFEKSWLAKDAVPPVLKDAERAILSFQHYK